ncbi:MAG: alanine--tRNA ligase, partial [Bacilli bacterium]|nr:alanine--tRNA ligase [Bacilli bacterium]
MRKLSGREIRQVWIKFFQSKGHVYIPGVPLIPQGDKSLLWVNAGVTGLKKYFDGSEIPPSRRIVNVQKSIRTNDIENVGHTARHHTFFEMLGNFSIGDYFRDEVIPWAAEILTSEEVGFGIPFEKLYITYSPLDKATHDLWVKCGVPEDHLIPLEGNFWEIGEGPCGPDTEMFFDRGPEYDPKGLGVELLKQEIENDRYIEIWNIVFSQYNSVAGVARKDYKELPSKNIDTGSGLERIACVLQGTDTNFETDLFTPVIEKTKELSGAKYEGANKMAFRVIADHARCLTFALSDGASFSNEGRGYVLRRIIRRAMRYGKKLGIDHPFMYGLVDTVIAEYKDFYPNLETKREYIVKSIENEERKFLRTLVSGEALLREKIEGKDTLEGADAFLLYDTFGFPFDLTKEICLEAGVKVDEEGFNEEMKKQKERARAARND